ncbi:class I adenylate-forming enzyme family protein [Streptomyces sp. NBC_00306]|uniref:class I adenylate-forming enzyme family protein n=1 Tax=Streptomyces sp. NBC_00306 TaxID=2975708 RepID=UPI002E2D7363|nr:AMP-binding protein [Streptomyces sp. NBC_00306]
MWLQQLLHRKTTRSPQALALRDQRRDVTWARLGQDARALADAIGDHVAPGGRVVLLTANRVELIEALFACALTGTIAVPVNPVLVDREVEYILDRVGAQYAIADQAGRSRLASMRPALVTMPIEEVAAQPLPTGRISGLDGHTGSALTDPLVILHTSATTGLPKGAVCDQRYLQFQALSWLAEVRPDAGAVFLNAGPLSHGSMVIALNYLAADGTLCVLDQFSPHTFLDAVPRWQAEHTFLVPAMLKLLLESRRLTGSDLSSLRLILHGGAPCPKDLADRATAVLGIPLHTIFGITEASGPALSCRPDDQPGAAALPGATCAGLPMPGFTARIANQDGTDASPHTVGTLHLRCDGLMRGYWNDPEATARALANGWLNTGDLGYRDEYDYVWLVDRRSDLILRGGQNVYPAEIEHVLRPLPWVAEVAVVAAPSPHWGQTPVAFIEPLPGAAFDERQLISTCVRELAGYKRPSRFVRVDAMPRSNQGKLLRRALREQAANVELGGESS